MKGKVIHFFFLLIYSLIIGFSFCVYCLSLLILRLVFAHFFRNDFLWHCVCDYFLLIHSLHAKRSGQSTS
jgi:hypothetical protein